MSSLHSLALALALLTTAGASGIAAAQGAAPAPAGAPQAAPVAVPGQPAAPVVAPISKPAPAVAAKPAPLAGKPMWKDLSPPQQVALDPLKGEWDRMESVRKQKWLDIANRYSSMKPDEQLRMQERMRDWTRLTPDERRVARENYTLSKKIDKSQKSAEWEKYQQLPEEEKKKLALDAAAAKKQVTNLPPATQVKPLAPSKPPPAGCPPGTIRNAPAAVPRCIAAPSAGYPLAVPATPPAVTAPPTTAPAAPVQATPVSNAK
ncbi:DUF3106 domain-containing protein [Massilia atriviolacea]|uniref:DUF3106 domain-containing protein n=1 Tax=Massilia atriviolacea TaxID=2495579 RepID=A0A430HJX5_9BURK|nr:DUF3106 domain-containing protein [Massilia atriviolacea]RSZ57828.1 DUF3106 domain-containing protein [Massilia atriviolacea]